MDENTMLERAKQVVQSNRPLTDEERLFLEMVAKYLKDDDARDNMLSKGVGGVIGGAAASIIFGPFALLPIAAGIIGGAAFGGQTHRDAFKHKEELLKHIETRLLRG